MSALCAAPRWPSSTRCWSRVRVGAGRLLQDVAAGDDHNRDVRSRCPLAERAEPLPGVRAPHLPRHPRAPRRAEGAALAAGHVAAVRARRSPRGCRRRRGSSPTAATWSRSRTRTRAPTSARNARSRRCARAAGSCIRAVFARDGWLGFPDFLIRVDEPSDLGAWSYEVYDAKLGSHPQPRHIFQLLFYTDELERIQGRRPERMHLMLGDGTTPAFAPDDFAAYAARVRAQFEARYAELAGADPDPAYPYKVGECQFCHWWKVCRDRRRDDDHVSLVANLHRGAGPEARGRRHPAPSPSSPISPRRRPCRG